MIETRFDRTLKNHGYKVVSHSRYEGECVYEKEHLYVKIICTVAKDRHGKAQDMWFHAVPGKKIPRNMDQLKTFDLDIGYLVKEASMIYDAFEALRNQKGFAKRYVR